MFQELEAGPAVAIESEAFEEAGALLVMNSFFPELEVNFNKHLWRPVDEEASGSTPQDRDLLRKRSLGGTGLGGRAGGGVLNNHGAGGIGGIGGGPGGIGGIGGGIGGPGGIAGCNFPYASTRGIGGGNNRGGLRNFTV